MSFAAIIMVTAFLTISFRAPLFADLKSSSRGRMRSTSSKGKHSAGSSASDMPGYEICGQQLDELSR